MFSRQQVPHWLNSKNPSKYKSSKILGKLWNLMEDHIEKCYESKDSSSTRNRFILNVVESYSEECSKSSNNDMQLKLNLLRKKMKDKVLEYDKTLDSFKKTKEYNDNDMRNSWYSRIHEKYYKELILCEKGEDAKNLTAGMMPFSLLRLLLR